MEGTPRTFLVAVLCTALAAATPVWGWQQSTPPAAPGAPSGAAPAGGAAAPASPPAVSTAPQTDAEIERFLTLARIVETKGAGKGVTGSTRATLSDGTATHDAHIQTIDEEKREFRSSMGTEFDFADKWSYNIAAYRLDRLIGLNLVPVSVLGRFRSARAAVTWWVDDVMMDEGGRLKQNLDPPQDKARMWNEQIYMMRLFDQLIYNTDRNLGNMLITKDWRLWAIDHTRAFRRHKSLKAPAHVSRCDRQVFERLKALTFDAIKQQLDEYLDDGQIRAILARRDAIVAKLEGLGPAAFFDRTPLRAAN